MIAEKTFSSRPVPLRRQFSRPKKSGFQPAFWDCGLSKFEVVLLALVVLIAAALHMGPILNSALGTPMVYVLAVISYLSPITGFFFIACSQFLPFPETSPNNPAQVGVLVWLPVILLRYHRVNLHGLWRLWPVIPWLLWYMILTGEAIYRPNSEYVKALLYCVIACQLANEARGRYLKCLVGLCLGAILVMTAYWAFELGLPVEISDWGGERDGFVRMGSVRADSVLVWPALLLGVSGLMGIQIAFASRSAPHPAPKWLTYLSLVLMMASLPPLVSTMCNGAFAGLALVVIALIGAIWIAIRGGAMVNPRFRQLIHWCLAGVALVVLMFAFDAFQIRTKTFALNRFHQEQSEELGGAAASRTGVWHDAIHTILSYPLFGIAVTGDQEEITSEYAGSGGYLAHNVFLDYGRSTGIPGMLLLAFFFFWPAVQMWQSRQRVLFLPFLLAHFALLIFWMSLSFQFYKTFWALWMLMAIAIARPLARLNDPLAAGRGRRPRVVSNGSRRINRNLF